MGFRVLMISIAGKDPATIHREYGVTPTDQFYDEPEPPIAGATFPNGAYLLFIQDWIIPNIPLLTKLSRNATLIACYANETNNESWAAGWKDGVRQWSVNHHLERVYRDSSAFWASSIS